jgi:hypothetical protein
MVEGDYEPRVLAGRTDAALEHEVELLWLSYGVPAVGVTYFVFFNELAELGARVVVEL